MSGWIKMHRKILDNPVVCKDSDHLAVWNYLLLSATHKEYPAVFSGEKITLQPGQLITGRKAIAEKFKISESKVQRILKSFEIEHQIEQQGSNKNRLVTVLSWDEYQNVEQQDEPLVNNKRTTTEQQLNTNKNVKKDKNEKNEEKKDKYPDDSPYFKMSVYFYGKICEWTDKVSMPDFQKWADDFRKISELDKREKADIRNVIDWVTKDSFWQANILSPSKLRAQFEKLQVQMERPQRQQFAVHKGGQARKPPIQGITAANVTQAPRLSQEEMEQARAMARKLDEKFKTKGAATP